MTVKALRFYETEGLIQPTFTDPATGYRYYDSSQLPLVHKIVALRQCGFPVSEVREIIRGRNVALHLAEQKIRLERDILERQAELSSINSYLDSISGSGRMEYQVVVKSLPHVTVFSMRTVVPSYDSLFSLVPSIGEEIGAANPGLRCRDDPPYGFIIYHDGEYRDSDIDIEYCEAVYEAGRDTDRICFKVIDGVERAACVLHKGPYSQLRHAYCAVYKWMEDNHLFCAQPPREAQIDGIWNTDDPADWLTEVQVPLL